MWTGAAAFQRGRPCAASSSSCAATAICLRVSGSVTTTIRRPWLNPALGAHTTAACVTRSSTCRGTGRSAYVRTLRRRRTTPRNSTALRHGDGGGVHLRLPEILVDEGDRHAALADGGRDTLHGAGADVAACEDPRHARLEQVRIALELPPPVGEDVRAGEHEAAPVERDLGRKPGGLGVRADEDVQTTGLGPLGLPRHRVLDVDRLERLLAVRGDDLGAVDHPD